MIHTVYFEKIVLFNLKLKNELNSINDCIKKIFAECIENFENCLTVSTIGFLIGIVVVLQKDSINALYSKRNSQPLKKINVDSLLKISFIFSMCFFLISFFGIKNKQNKLDTPKSRYSRLKKAIEEQNFPLVKQIVKKKEDLSLKHAFKATWYSFREDNQHNNKIRNYLFYLFYSKNS